MMLVIIKENREFDLTVEPSRVKKLLSKSKESTLITLYVKPSHPKTMLVLEGDELVFYTDEPPLRGRANASLAKFLAKALGVSSSRISIVSGVKSRVKRVEIKGMEPDEVAILLSRVIREK